jgi:hypothetical protein
MKSLIACVVLCYCYLLCQGAPGAKGRAEPSAKRQSPESESSLSPAPAPQKKLFSLLFAQAAAPKCSETSSFISLFEYFFPTMVALAHWHFLVRFRGPQGTPQHTTVTPTTLCHCATCTVPHCKLQDHHTVCTGCNCNCQCGPKGRWARATANLKRDVQYLYSPMSRTYRTARTGTPHNCARLEPGLPLKDLSLSARVKVRLCPMSILVFSFCEKWVPGFVVRSDALQYVASMTVDDDGFVGFCDTCDGGWRWIGWDWNLTGSGIESLEI